MDPRNASASKNVSIVKLLFFHYRKIKNIIGIQSFYIDQLSDFEKIDFEQLALVQGLEKLPETPKRVQKLKRIQINLGQLGRSNLGISHDHFKYR